MKSSSNDETGINLLILDAGSPGGVQSEMHILEELMRQLRTCLGREDLLPSDYFDLIGGSGIGAFAALCVGPLGMTAIEAIETVKILIASVFYENTKENRKTVFDSNELRDTARGIIEGTGHSPDAMIGTIAPKSHSKAVFFVSPVVDIASCHRLRSYRSRKGMLQCTVLEVALACISTLGLFDHAEIGSGRRKYTSAGMHHTNPIKDVLDEAEQIFGAEKRVSCIISLGAGTRLEGSVSSNLTHLDVHGLLQAMETQQRLVTEEATRQFGNLEAYYRFSVDGVGSGHMSDWTQVDTDLVELRTQSYLAISSHSAELDAAVHQLSGRCGTVTLNSLNHASSVAVTVKAVPPVTQFFILRKKSWEFIEEKLTKAPSNKRTVFVLSGLGGAGKSTLFSYYVQTYGSKYSHIFFVDASSVQSIKTDLQNAVRSLGPEHSQKTWEDALQDFGTPGHDQNWLIGFDNPDDVALPLQDYMPDGEHGTIFITSRNRDLFFLTSGDLHWELGPMTEEEALDALLSSAQRPTPSSVEDLEDGARLAERLGRLPLALVQAGVYCFQHKCVVDGVDIPFTFRQYLDEMDKNHSSLMSHPATQSLDHYGKSVYQSLNMSYSALPQLTRDFLHLCGYFHRSNIPLLMLEDAVDGQFTHPEKHDYLKPAGDAQIKAKLASILQPLGKSVTIHLHKLIFSLKMFSLVTTTMIPYSVMLNFHALVNTWARDILPPSDQKLYSAMATRVVATCGEEKYYLVHTLLLPTVVEIISTSSDLSCNDMATFAERLRFGGMGAEAEALWWRLYKKSSKELGAEHMLPLVTLHNLADTIRYLGRYEEAAKLQEETSEKLKTVYSEEYFTHTEINLAATYVRQGRYNEADEILQRLYPIAVAYYGRDDNFTLMIMQNMSISLLDQGRVQEAAMMQEEILQIRKRTLGRDHPDITIMMVNLAASYVKLSPYEDAENLEEPALEIFTRTNGKEHPDTLLAMSNLANTRYILGKLDEAVVLGERALYGFRKVFGSSHPDTCRSTVC